MLSLIRLLSRTNKTALGRWECTGPKDNKIKIDWANVDHCGTCSYKIQEPKKIENIPIKQLPKNQNLRVFPIIHW